MLSEKINNVDEEVLVSIYKAIEIYDTLKNTRLRINNERVNSLDKKYLSLLLGIYFKDNSVSKIMRLFRFDYGIQVYTINKTEEEYVAIYKENFQEILDSVLTEENYSIEQFMLILIENNFIKKIHINQNLPLNAFKVLLTDSVNIKDKEKTLQKK